MFRVICLLIGYAFGMIQTSYIMGRLNGIDIREHGSKNAGFTNTNRVLGIKKGAVVFVIDVLKSMAAFAVATIVVNHFQLFSMPLSQRFAWQAGGTFFSANEMYNLGIVFVLPGLYAGLGAILGHVFPLFLKFKGGKGVACALGLIIMLDWRVMAISFAIGFIAVALTKFISVASLLITLSVPILMALFGYQAEVILLTAGLCAFIWFLHRENIKRLISGTENKFSFKKSNPAT